MAQVTAFFKKQTPLRRLLLRTAHKRRLFSEHLLDLKGANAL